MNNSTLNGETIICGSNLNVSCDAVLNKVNIQDNLIIYNDETPISVGINTNNPLRNLDMSSTGTIGFGSNYQLTEGSGIYWNSGSNYGVYCSLEFVEGNVDGEVPPVPEPEAPGLTYEYIQVGDTIPVNPETNANLIHFRILLTQILMGHIL